MPREHPEYRDNLELLNRRFPDYDMLSLEEVAQVLNHKTTKTTKKLLGAGFVDRRLSKVKLARYMCGESN
jgi:hypothetical protein